MIRDDGSVHWEDLTPAQQDALAIVVDHDPAWDTVLTWVRSSDIEVACVNGRAAQALDDRGLVTCLTNSANPSNRIVEVTSAGRAVFRQGHS